MLCSISGEAPLDPVVSPKSGALFERRLIVKYLSEHGVDPISNEPLTESELITIKSAPGIVRPRPPSATSIPALLASFQNEWDAVMLETFELRLKYRDARQELTGALYNHDAACRVIARLSRERDEARNALANVKESLGAAQQVEADGMDVDRPQASSAQQQEGITDEIIEKMAEVSANLSKVRRKRKPASTLTPTETLSTFSQTRDIRSLHSSTNPGILALDLQPSSDLALTGGKDGAICLVDVAAGKVKGEMTKAHGGKKINCLAWSGTSSYFLSGGSDKVVRLWQAGDDGAEARYVVKSAHQGDVTGVSVHPGGEYFVSCGADGVWSFVGMEEGKVVKRVEHGEVQAYTTCRFHPDGLILGTGTSDSRVRLWDIKAQSNVATFSHSSGRISALAFSENGYTVATGSDSEGVVRIWDLRKLEQVSAVETGGKGVQCVAFDWSGQYLAVAAGGNVGVYPHKTFTPPILELESAHEGKEVTAVAWGTDAKYLLSAGMDRIMRVYSE